MTPGTLLALVGAVVLRLTLSGAYLRYVQNGMRPWLLIAGVALVALGAITVLRSVLRRGGDDEHEQPREGWLLLANTRQHRALGCRPADRFDTDRAAIRRGWV